MMKTLLNLASASAIASGAVLSPANAGDPRAGAAFARDNCAGCHATGGTGTSPNPKSPTFRAVAQKYKLEDLEEGLAEGIVTGHNTMPEFTLTPRQIDDLLAHLRRLKGR